MRNSKDIAVPEIDSPQPVIRIYVLADQYFKFFYHKLKTAIIQHRLSCERCTNKYLKGAPHFLEIIVCTKTGIVIRVGKIEKNLVFCNPTILM
jgi:hypothetical protein